ncbi:MAG: D-alanyl-D-alanine carboxypeptidase, partial [Candidatus Kapaibacterium sp.]
MARIVATMLVVMAADISVVAEGTRVAADGRVQTAERKSDTLRPELRQDRRPGRQALRELQRDIDGILASRDFYRANIGVSVVSADNGEVIYRMNDERMFVPASTQKLFTTAVALETLGKDFRYRTRLYL